MPDRARIYALTETIEDGDVIELHGPGPTGAIDWNMPIAGARRAVRRGPVGRGAAVPAGLGPAGQRTRIATLLSAPLVFGAKEFGVKRYDRDTGTVNSGMPQTARVFVNSAPSPARDLTPAEQPVGGGKLKFTFTPGTFT